MNAAALTGGLPRSPHPRTARADDLVPFWLGGPMFGTLMIAACFLVDGFAITMRRSFVIGSMFSYVLLTPVVWTVIVGVANTAN